MLIQRYHPRLAHAKTVSDMNSAPLSTYAPNFSIIPTNSSPPLSPPNFAQFIIAGKVYT
jgi:hypothetical protein